MIEVSCYNKKHWKLEKLKMKCVFSLNGIIILLRHEFICLIMLWGFILKARFMTVNGNWKFAIWNKFDSIIIYDLLLNCWLNLEIRKSFCYVRFCWEYFNKHFSYEGFEIKITRNRILSLFRCVLLFLSIWNCVKWEKSYLWYMNDETSF